MAAKPKKKAGRKRISDKDRKERNINIADDMLKGTRPNTVANKNDLSTQQVYRILSTPEVRECLEHAGSYLIENCLPIAIQKHEELLQSDDPKVLQAAIALCYKTTGMTPGPVSNLIIQQVYNDQRQVNAAIPPQTAKLLEHYNLDIAAE